MSELGNGRRGGDGAGDIGGGDGRLVVERSDQTGEAGSRAK